MRKLFNRADVQILIIRSMIAQMLMRTDRDRRVHNHTLDSFDWTVKNLRRTIRSLREAV